MRQTGIIICMLYYNNMYHGLWHTTTSSADSPSAIALVFCPLYFCYANWNEAL